LLIGDGIARRPIGRRVGRATRGDAIIAATPDEEQHAPQRRCDLKKPHSEGMPRSIHPILQVSFLSKPRRDAKVRDSASICSMPGAIGDPQTHRPTCNRI
jgi:hypothetical protein